MGASLSARSHCDVAMGRSGGKGFSLNGIAGVAQFDREKSAWWENGSVREKRGSRDVLLVPLKVSYGVSARCKVCNANGGFGYSMRVGRVARARVSWLPH